MNNDNRDEGNPLSFGRRQILGPILRRHGDSTVPGYVKNEWRLVLTFIFSGTVLAVVAVHPLIELFHWWRTGNEDSAFDLMGGLRSSLSAYSLEMLPMTLMIAIGGGLAGLLFGILQLRLFRWRSPDLEIRTSGETDLAEIIRTGESERVEFKSSLRWDEKSDRLNKKLELAIVKSIAGFMNRDGGDLLIGVGDRGDIKGIERDCQTLSHPDWDGFERTLMNLVTDRLGAAVSMLIKNRKYDLDSKSVCRVSVQPAGEPVFCKDGNIERYYVRAGNTTRELDAREAVDHISRRRRAVFRQDRDPM